MDETPRTGQLPESLQRILTLGFTVIAALLYAGILGAVIVQTLLGRDGSLTAGASRIATVLGGLVGAVVSSGFAGSWRPGSVQLRTDHPVGGDTSSNWWSLRPPSRLRTKFAGLARLLGFASRGHSALDAAPGSEETPEEPDPTAIGMALLYAAIYFLVGTGAFLLVLIKPTVPEIIESSAWTWVGSLVASAYTFFGVDAAS